MGNRTVKNTAQSVSHKRHSRMVARDYVEEIQQRAGKPGQLSESSGNTDRDAASAERWEQKPDEQTVPLQVEASCLVEEIEDLSNGTGQSTRNRSMTETSVTKQRQAQNHRRREQNAAKAGTGKLSFNPLHPSMELPPEHLIRLLGLETKKTRQHQKAQQVETDKNRGQSIDETPPVTKSEPVAEPKPHAKANSVTETVPATETTSVTKTRPTVGTKSVTAAQPDIEPSAPSRSPATSARPARREQAATPPVSTSNRLGLLIPATAIGVVVGALISALLLWPRHESAPVTKAETNSPPAQSIDRGSAAKKVSRQPVPATPPDRKALQAAIQEQRRRLHLEAEQRLSERLKKHAIAPQTPAAAPVFSYEAAEAALVPPGTDQSRQPSPAIAQDPGVLPGVNPEVQNPEETTLAPETGASAAYEPDNSADGIDSETTPTESVTAAETQPAADEMRFPEPIPDMESEKADDPLNSAMLHDEPAMEDDLLSNPDQGMEPQAEYIESGEEPFTADQPETGSGTGQEPLTEEPSDNAPVTTQEGMDIDVMDEPLAGEAVDAVDAATTQQSVSTTQAAPEEPEAEHAEAAIQAPSR